MIRVGGELVRRSETLEHYACRYQLWTDSMIGR